MADAIAGAAPKKPRRKRAKKAKATGAKRGGKRRGGPGFFGRLRARFGRKRGSSVAKKSTRRSSSKGKTSTAIVLVGGGGAPMIPRRGGKKRGGAMTHRKGRGGSRGFTTTEVLVDGLLVVGGAAAAVQIDKMVTTKPLGVNPSVIALGVTIAVAVAGRKMRKPKLSRGAASVAVGLAAGIVGKTLTARAAGGGTPAV